MQERFIFAFKRTTLKEMFMKTNTRFFLLPLASVWIGCCFAPVHAEPKTEGATTPFATVAPANLTAKNLEIPPAANIPTIGGSYIIKDGELLWDIARKVYTDNTVNRYQAMYALWKMNPQAFSTSCNIHSLQAGQTLTIPSLADFSEINANEVAELFKRQKAEWQIARRNGQTIACPATVSNSANSAALATTPPPPIPSQIIPPPAAVVASNPSVPVSSLPASRLPTVSLPTTATPLPAQTPPFPPMPEVSTPNFAEQLATFIRDASQLTLLLIGGGVLLCSFILGILLTRWFTPKPVQPNAMNMNLPAVPEKSPYLSNAIWGNLPSDRNASLAERRPSAEPAPSTESLNLDRKLIHIRDCLATEGETQAIKIMLQEVIERGNAKQREEARQLLEIGRKMNQLERRTESIPSIPPRIEAIPHIETPPAPPVDVSFVAPPPPVEEHGKEHNKAFDLMDKMLTFLDNEMNAQGKLKEAYLTQWKNESLDTKDYQVVEKEEIIKPDSTADEAHFVRRT